MSVVLSNNEATGVLYGENVFRAHRIDDKNENAASIKRAKFFIGRVAPDDAEDVASEPPKFLNNHPNLEQSRALNSVSNC